MATSKSSFRAENANRALAEGLSAHRRGDLTTARRCYRKALKLQPHHSEGLRLSGVLAHQCGRTREALQLLNAAQRHARPGTTHALDDLGMIYLQSGEHDQAEAVLRRALEIRPESLTTLLRLGSTMITTGRAREAIEVFERARSLDPEHPSVRYSLAHALLEDRQFEAAIGVSDEALAGHPKDLPNLIVKGTALLQLERFEEAAGTLGLAVEVEPRDVNAWSQLGRARRRLGDREGAVEALRQATRLAPLGASEHSQLANTLASFESFDEALAVCDDFLERQPASPAIIVVKALALRDAGRAEEADALLGLERLVTPRALQVPAGYADVDPFNDELADMILNHPNLGCALTNRATRHGVHTGYLDLNEPPLMRKFVQAVDAAIRATKSELEAGPEADHPWVRHAPPDWRIEAWAVVLNDQGHQLSHIHPQAWMSGVYYVAVPEDGIGAGHGEDGWIEFGRPSDQLTYKVAPPVRSIEPRPGTIVLFPSFTFHRTKPFASTRQRISIAFDIFPKR